MANIDFVKTSVQADASNVGTFQKVTAAFGAWVTDTKRARENRAAINALRQMSDRELADIGVSRYQIVDAVLGRLNERNL